ncbi:hypothetical protein HYDPIDRAFT_110584 [Hydnomerulius pinastri MD-312]|nr:hypothetical protein HYDPIDRAFT_110584 [Hydnomerulius pinastri MD-312]
MSSPPLFCGLLYEIFRHVYGRRHNDAEYPLVEYGFRLDQWYDEPRKTLASLARTCSAFQGPALDVLWEELPTMEPLIRCLPNDLWTLNSPDGTLKFVREFTDSDWAVFRRYANRVKVLGFRHSGHPDAESKIVSCVAVDVLQTLKQFLPSQPHYLLPRLRDMHWLHEEKEYLQFLPIFLSPNLAALTLPTRCWPESVRHHLSSLGRTCPEMRSFHYSPLRYYHSRRSAPGREERSTLSDSLRQWKTLESIHTCPLDEATMRHLTSLKTLRELSIWVLEQCPQYQSKIEFSSTLDTIQLRASDDAFLLSALSTIHFSPRRVILMMDNVAPGSLQTLLQSLPSFFPANLLTSLSVISFDTTHAELGSQPIKSLCHYKSLKILHLRGVTVDIGDQELEDLARSLPSLEMLDVLGSSWRRSDATVSARGLLSLVKHCPHLVKLGVHADAMGLRADDCDLRDSALAELVLGIIPPGLNIEDPQKIAHNLVTLFPRLKKVGYVRRSDNPEQQQLWREVNDLLRGQHVDREGSSQGS